MSQPYYPGDWANSESSKCDMMRRSLLLLLSLCEESKMINSVFYRPPDGAPDGLPTRAVTMKFFVLPRCPHHPWQLEPSSRPLAPAFGDAMKTPKVLRSLAPEGRNQDGLVHLTGQAVVTAPVACTVPHLVSAANVNVAPVAAGKTAVAPVAYTVPDVYATASVAVEEHADAVEVEAAPAAVVPVTYTHAVSSVGVPASTELLTRTAVAAPAIQYVAAPLTPFVHSIPVAATAAAVAPAAEEAAGVEVA